MSMRCWIDEQKKDGSPPCPIRSVRPPRVGSVLTGHRTGRGLAHAPGPSPRPNLPYLRATSWARDSCINCTWRAWALPTRPSTRPPGLDSALLSQARCARGADVLPRLPGRTPTAHPLAAPTAAGARQASAHRASPAGTLVCSLAQVEEQTSPWLGPPSSPAPCPAAGPEVDSSPLAMHPEGQHPPGPAANPQHPPPPQPAQGSLVPLLMPRPSTLPQQLPLLLPLQPQGQPKQKQKQKQKEKQKQKQKQKPQEQPQGQPQGQAQGQEPQQQPEPAAKLGRTGFCLTPQQAEAVHEELLRCQRGEAAYPQPWLDPGTSVVSPDNKFQSACVPHPPASPHPTPHTHRTPPHTHLPTHLRSRQQRPAHQPLHLLNHPTCGPTTHRPRAVYSDYTLKLGASFSEKGLDSENKPRAVLVDPGGEVSGWSLVHGVGTMCCSGLAKHSWVGAAPRSWGRVQEEQAWPLETPCLHVAAELPHVPPFPFHPARPPLAQVCLRLQGTGRHQLRRPPHPQVRQVRAGTPPGPRQRPAAVRLQAHYRLRMRLGGIHGRLLLRLWARGGASRPRPDAARPDAAQAGGDHSGQGGGRVAGGW
jgi:hypothetical protein